MAYPPSAFYVNYGNGSSTGYYGVAQWASGTPVAGQLCRQLTAPAVGSERVFVCVVAGVDAVEPVWTVTKGALNVGGSATWQECTGQPGVNGDVSANQPSWAASQTPVLGQIIQALVSATVTLQICTTSGAGGTGAAPSFSATAGVTTADSSATWTSLGAASNFAAWAAPFARLQSAQTTNWAAAGNTIFVGDNHAETQASAMTLTAIGTLSAPLFIYCVDHTASVPPTSANIKTTATISTTGANGITFANTCGDYVYGITFQAGSSSNAASITFFNSTSGTAFGIFDNCGFTLNNTSSSSTFAIGQFRFLNEKQVFRGCTFTFGAVGQQFSLQSGQTLFRNCVLAGTAPTTLINGVPATALTVLIFEGCDLSLVTGTLVGTISSNPLTVYLINCKLGTGATVAAALSATGQVDVINSDSTGTTYQNQRYVFEGTMLPSTTVVRTGGATNGVTPTSWQVATQSGSLWVNPFECFPIPIWNTVTGTNRNVTLYGVWNSASLPNNDQVWYDVEYLGSSGSPLASLGSGTKANNLATGSAWTADTSAWDGAASAWLQNHTYSAGAIVSGSSVGNAGRLFYCTVGGTSTTGSPPGAFASAVDGGTVTDNTATWRAMVRFSMTVTLSAPQPQLQGYLRTYVKAATASTTFYVDPRIVLG